VPLLIATLPSGASIRVSQLQKACQICNMGSIGTLFASRQNRRLSISAKSVIKGKTANFYTKSALKTPHKFITKEYSGPNLGTKFDAIKKEKRA
jgi:hypothetical protein